MPVLAAAIEAIVVPEGRHRWWNATTGDTHPVVIVNGPIAKQIRLNSGYGCLGPDPLHPAGGMIGRAIRFLLMNVGGAIPGSGTMALYGGQPGIRMSFLPKMKTVSPPTGSRSMLSEAFLRDKHGDGPFFEYFRDAACCGSGDERRSPGNTG